MTRDPAAPPPETPPPPQRGLLAFGVLILSLMAILYAALTGEAAP
jgi:uncharacterized protein involved in exopolysaccharide biosynthesis